MEQILGGTGRLGDMGASPDMFSMDPEVTIFDHKSKFQYFDLILGPLRIVIHKRFELCKKNGQKVLNFLTFKTKTQTLSLLKKETEVFKIIEGCKILYKTTT